MTREDVDRGPGAGSRRAAFAARFGGFVVMVGAMIAFMAGARPVDRAASPRFAEVANGAGVGLTSLGVTGFVAGRALERRAQREEALALEARAQRPRAA
jgi:hypothetical protein